MVNELGWVLRINHFAATLVEKKNNFHELVNNLQQEKSKVQLERGNEIILCDEATLMILRRRLFSRSNNSSLTTQ